MTDTELSYERAVELFDEKLKALEEGNLSLEAALQAVDEAGRYLRTAQQRLEEARKRIEVRPLDTSAGAGDMGQAASQARPQQDDEVPF